jgi:hypothetical protein
VTVPERSEQSQVSPPAGLFELNERLFNVVSDLVQELRRIDPERRQQLIADLDQEADALRWQFRIAGAAGEASEDPSGDHATLLERTAAVCAACVALLTATFIFDSHDPT